MTLRSALPLLMLALAAACGGGTTGMTMDAHLKELGGLITTATTDLDAHKTAVHAAADLPAILALEGPHATKMSTHMTTLGSSVSEASHCTKAGAAPDTTMMTDAMTAMKSEETAHSNAMAGVATAAAAHTEEDRHNAAMAAQLTKLKDQQTSMMATASGYTCAAHSTH